METQTTSLWHRALHDRQLQDLPFKIETNEYGQLVLSPHKPRHSFVRSRILVQLLRHVKADGEPTIEFSVETPKGVKVPDAVWISSARRQQIPDEAEAGPVMPELCVEVLSESNTNAEMAKKRRLYFETGAQDVWTCDPDGHNRFFDVDGEQTASALAPSFTTSIE